MNSRDIIIIVVSIIVGGLCALAARSVFYSPHEQPKSIMTHRPVKSEPTTTDHSNHATSHAEKPVNTICAICGMDVDGELPTAQYQGKTIGFGCKKCVGMFTKEPDRYGPYYLKNVKYPE